MGWKDKTVSLGNVDSKEFESDLAHITVSEKGISVEFKDMEDWKRIKREIGEEKILKHMDWDEVEGLGKETEHLYYPHIDIETGEGEKRLYFLEDDEEMMDECLSTVKNFWNAYRQRGAGSRNSYSFKDGETEDIEEGGEEAELIEEEDEKEENTEEEEETDDGEKGSVKDVVEGFMEG